VSDMIELTTKAVEKVREIMHDQGDHRGRSTRRREGRGLFGYELQPGD
jgi:hypothetical protein